MASPGALGPDAPVVDTPLPLPLGSRELLAALERDRLGGVCSPLRVSGPPRAMAGRAALLAMQHSGCSSLASPPSPPPARLPFHAPAPFDALAVRPRGLAGCHDTADCETGRDANSHPTNWAPAFRRPEVAVHTDASDAAATTCVRFSFVPESSSDGSHWPATASVARNAVASSAAKAAEAAAASLFGVAEHWEVQVGPIRISKAQHQVHKDRDPC